MQVTDEMLYQHAAAARDFWLSTLPADDEIPKHKFSRRFKKKMNRLLREQRRSPWANNAIRTMRRVAAVILVVGVLSFSGLMTVKAYREKVVEVITQVFHDLTNYRFVAGDMAEEFLNSLPEVSFQYIPDGMKKIDETICEYYYFVLYETEDGKFFELHQTVITPNSGGDKILDTEDAVTETIYIGDHEAVSNVKGDVSSIFWTVDNVIYELYGTVGMTELKSIAEKIK